MVRCSAVVPGYGDWLAEVLICWVMYESSVPYVGIQTNYDTAPETSSNLELAASQSSNLEQTTALLQKEVQT